MPVLNANIRSFNSHAGSSKLHNDILWPVHACVCHSYQNNGNAAETNSSVFISLLDIHTFYPGLINEYGRTERLSFLSLFFHVRIFSVSGWLTQGSYTQARHDLTGCFGQLCFLECHCLPSAFKVDSDSKRKHHLSGLSAPLLTRS